MKVYVITKGEYSDYRICGVATDPEKADALAKFYSDRYDTAEVEEYDTEDNPDLTEGKKVFRMRFDRYGNADDIHEVDVHYYWYKKLPREYRGEPGFVYVFVQADTQEDAVKIGAERRAKYLAEKLGL